MRRKGLHVSFLRRLRVPVFCQAQIISRAFAIIARQPEFSRALFHSARPQRII